MNRRRDRQLRHTRGTRSYVYDMIGQTSGMTQEQRLAKESWRKLLKKLAQNTTLHGVRYLGEDSVFFRKVIWALITMCAMAAFLYIVAERALTLNKHKTTVNVEVIYNESLPFPSVTICNQNLFRQSAAHKYGLYDTIRESFDRMSRGEAALTDDEFELQHNQYLSGLKGAYTKYASVTPQVCKATCQKVEGNQCCSLIYIRASSTCYITPLQHNEDEAIDGARLVKRSGVDYYRRKKCEVRRSANCDFDSGLCNFIRDPSNSLHWEAVKGVGVLGSVGPKFDHTQLTSGVPGSYLHASTRSTDLNHKAVLFSAYILSSGSSCIDFYYQVHGGILYVKKIDMGQDVKVLWKRQKLESFDWEHGNVRLPTGYFRISFEARLRTSTERLNIALDDVRIDTCQEGKQCKETPTAIGYMGAISTGKSGTPCQDWARLPTSFLPSTWTGDLSDQDSFCRNPDGDSRGPWCFTDILSGQLEYCDVPTCECKGNVLSCDNGRCISNSLICDDINDCGDYSDERGCDPDQQPTVNCTFESHNCSYNTWRYSSLVWRTETVESNTFVTVDAKEAAQGDIAILMSPDAVLEDLGCLEFALYLTSATLDIFYSVVPGSMWKKYVCSVMELQPDTWNKVQINLTDVFQSASLTQRDGYNSTSSDPFTLSDAEDIDVTLARHFLFQATILDTSKSRVWIDNITVYEGECPVEEEEVTTTISLPTTTESPETTTSEETTVTEAATTTIQPTTEVEIDTTEDYNSTTATDNTTMVSTTQEPSTTLAEEMTSSSAENVTVSGKRKRRAAEENVTVSDLALSTTVSNLEVTPNNTEEMFPENVTTPEAPTTQSPITTTSLPVFEPKCPVNESVCLSCMQPLEPIGFDDCLFGAVCEDCPSSIQCFFSDGCSCGYQYVSSNINSRWFLYADGIVDNVTSSEYIADAAVTEGHGTSKDWTTLLSPIQTIQHTSCLRFLLSTKYVDFTLYKYNHVATDSVMFLSLDGQPQNWHMADVTLQPGSYGLAFKFLYGGDGGAAIDNVTLMTGSCEEIDFNQGGNVNCTFDDIYTCGYIDVTSGPRTWFRSKQYSNGSPGGYYMRTTETHVGKTSRPLLSPAFTLDTNGSCLQFYYFMRGPGKSELASYSVVLVPEFYTNDRSSLTTVFNTTVSPPGEERILLWEVRTIRDNAWHRGQAEVYHQGNYRLLFEINGADFQGGVDDITVSPGGCPHLGPTCREDDIACTLGAMAACVPKTILCDGLANCYDGQDERLQQCVRAPEDPDSPDDGDTDSESVKSSDVDYEKDMRSVPADVITDLTDLYFSVGHQSEDLIYKCTWEGEPCGEYNFTKLITDYGMCYSFNLQPNITGLHMDTAKTDFQPVTQVTGSRKADYVYKDARGTGSRYGLTLTVNIEQYEYMIGPNSDAGIKVFLHPEYEVPQVRDLGFAMPPGTHTLAGVQKNEAANLPDPWGDCGSRGLEYYDKYYYSRCMVECETHDLFSICHCRDAYMPGSIKECSLSEYFDCAVPALYSNKKVPEEGRNVTDCQCPKPCQQALYESSLSYATLSMLSVGQILDQDPEMLKSKFFRALETSQRTQMDIFTDDITMFNDILRMYEEYLDFVAQYMGDEDSVFQKIWIATQTMAKILLSDLDKLLGGTQTQQNIFQKSYGDTISLLTHQMDSFYIALKDIEQIMYLSKSSGTVVSRLQNAGRNARDLDVIVQETLDLLLKKYRNATLAWESASGDVTLEDVSYLPGQFFQNEGRCNRSANALTEAVVNLEGILIQVRKWRGNKVNSAFKTLSTDLQVNAARFYEARSDFSKCLEEYPTLLSEVLVWMEKTEQDVDEAYLSKNDAINEVSFEPQKDTGVLNADLHKARRAKEQYLLNNITKLQLISTFHSPDGQSEQVMHISSLTERLRSKVSDVLSNRISEADTSFELYYLTAMEKAARLQTYVSEQYYDKAKYMQIWKVTSPNLDNPTEFTDKSREIWRFWDRDVPIEDFVNGTANGASKYIDEGLDSFFQPLLTDLDSFDQQLLSKKDELILFVEKANDEHKSYQLSRKIDHQFILSNFMNIDVYFKQLKFQKVTQMKAYDLAMFWGDVGGFMGLLLGCSALSIFEFLDFLVYYGLAKLCCGHRTDSVNIGDGEPAQIKSMAPTEPSDSVGSTRNGYTYAPTKDNDDGHMENTPV